MTENNTNPKRDVMNIEAHLLINTFAPSAMIFTYKGFHDVRVEQVKRYELLCRTPQQNAAAETLKKIDVLFVIKSETLNAVKADITLDKTVKARNLRTALKRKDRPSVLTKQKLTRGQNRHVRIVMRSGHVLRGIMEAYSPYNIVLSIAGAVVLVYRHGVLEYAITPQQTQSR